MKRTVNIATVLCLAAALVLTAAPGARAASGAGTGPGRGQDNYSDILAGYIDVSNAGFDSALPPNTSFLYRYMAQYEERLEYEEQKRQEEIEAKLAAEEERRLNEMRRRVASLTDSEMDELYSADYFTGRMRELGYYTQDFSNESYNYRNAVIRLQAAMNMQVDAVLGAVSKKALIEGSPVIAHDEVASPASEGYWITINKSKNILTVYRGAEVHKKYPVATGRRPTLTPEGKFSFVSKSVNPAWGGGGYASPVAGGSPSNPLGRRWLGLSIGGGGRYGVHGNASPLSIGTYASAGCVRMINTDVESMYEYIPVGTPVWIGSDSKLAEFGIKQYYTITEAQAQPDDRPGYGPEPGYDTAPDIAGPSMRDAEYAAPIETEDDGP